MKKYILVGFSSALLTASFAQSWSLTGNSDASWLSSGTYRYSFYLDGRLINTNKLVLIK
jgi:hypothetical protein